MDLFSDLTSKTSNFEIMKTTAAIQPAKTGAINHEAIIWDTPFHPQITPEAPPAAIPAPIVPPTIEWVVETGRPIEVAIVNQHADPIKAQAMVNIKTVGSFSKIEASTILFLIVPETLAPASTEPKNSQIPANTIACQYFSDLDEIEEAKELATSFAPMLKASKNANSMVIAKI